MSNRIYNVLFLCTGNSARSILAEAILNRLGAGKFVAYSAGSQPTGKVNPFSLALLTGKDYDTGFARSKNWDGFAGPDAPVLDFIFTVCDNAAGEICPIWPGHPTSAHWGIADPAAAQGSDAEKQSAFTVAYDLLERRISDFCALDLDALTGADLKAKLSDIGRSAD